MTHATAHTQAAGPATPTAGAAPIVDLRAVSKRFGHANDGILERVPVSYTHLTLPTKA